MDPTEFSFYFLHRTLLVAYRDRVKKDLRNISKSNVKVGIR